MKARSLDEKMLLLGKYLRWKNAEVFSNIRQNDKLVFVETDEHKFFITWTCLVPCVQHAADKGGFLILSAYPTKEKAFDAFFESCRNRILHEENLSIEGIELKLEVAGLA